MAKIDDEVKTKFINNRHRFITNMVFTSNWFMKKFDEFLKPFQLSQQQFNILRILRGNGDWATMNDIKSLMIDKFPNATRLSDKLLEKELIERRRSDSDRRIVYLKISEKGLELLKEIDESDNQEHLDIMNKVTEEEARIFSDVLDRMRE